MNETSNTHRAYPGDGYSVTVQHCEGPGADGAGCDAYLGTNYPSIFCDDCRPRSHSTTAGARPGARHSHNDQDATIA